MATTIQVDKVFGPRQAGKGEVYDVRLVNGDKWSAWNQVGKLLSESGPGTYEVTYEARPKNGYENLTVLSVVSGVSTSPVATSTNGGSARSATDDKNRQINRSVAFKGAIDLYVASGNVTGTLEDIAAITELTDALLLVVEGAFTTVDGEES